VCGEGATTGKEAARCPGPGCGVAKAEGRGAAVEDAERGGARSRRKQHGERHSGGRERGRSAEKRWDGTKCRNPYSSHGIWLPPRLLKTEVGATCEHARAPRTQRVKRWYPIVPRKRGGGGGGGVEILCLLRL
jgi:hypothetical protein